MAKKGTRLNNVVLECAKCGGRNYVTSRGNIQPIKKLAANRHCKNCRVHTEHKESK